MKLGDGTEVIDLTQNGTDEKEQSNERVSQQSKKSDKEEAKLADPVPEPTGDNILTNAEVG
jgi:hypothetical protein